MDEFNCISDQDWIAYSRGELNATQLRVIQKHCAQCEMCLDTKEGIDQMKDSSLLKDEIENIHVEIDQKTRSKFFLLNPIGMGIAASILLAMLLFRFLMPTKEQIALQKEPIQTETESGLASPEQKSIPLSSENSLTKKSIPNKKSNTKNTESPLPNKVTKRETNSLPSITSIIENPKTESESVQDVIKEEAQLDFSIAKQESISKGIDEIKENQNNQVNDRRESKVSQVKPSYIPTSKKYTAPSANNYQNNNQVIANSNLTEEAIQFLKDSTLALLNYSNRLLDSNRFEEIGRICDTMLNSKDKTYYSQFVLLKTKALFKEKGKKEALIYLENQIQTKELKDVFLLNYRNFLRQE